MVAVDRRAGRIDKFLHAALSGRFHHVQCSADVVLLIENGHLNASRNASPCRLVQHIVHSVAGAAAGFQILDVSLDEGISLPVQEHFHVFLLSGGQIVQAPHFISHVQNRLAQVGTDEARSARYEKYRIFVKFQMFISHSHLLSKHDLKTAAQIATDEPPYSLQ